MALPAISYYYFTLSTIIYTLHDIVYQYLRYLPPQQPSAPVLSLTADPDRLTVGSPTFIYLEVDIPENSSTEYVVEFIMPYTNGKTRLSVCSAMVTFMGK